MSRTIVLSFTSLADAQHQFHNYKNDHSAVIIGPTDQVGVADNGGPMSVWRSGGNADYYLLVATKDPLAGPFPPTGD